MVRFLALGDSYTIGEGVSAAESWPAQLTYALRQHGLPVTTPIIIAQTGWTTDELMTGIEQANPDEKFNLVSLQIGVNNQYRESDVGTYRADFRMLLEKAITFAGSEPRKVIVLSIPDWGVTPFATGRNRSQITAEINEFNAVNYQEAKQAGTYYVDVTPESRLASEDPTLLASDGLHPSGKMYAAWVHLVLPAVLSSLNLGKPESTGEA